MSGGPEYALRLREVEAELARVRAEFGIEKLNRKEEVARLAASLSEAREVLRAVEWSGSILQYGDHADSCCPVCRAEEPGPHASDCRLDALLAPVSKGGAAPAAAACCAGKVGCPGGTCYMDPEGIGCAVCGGRAPYCRGEPHDATAPHPRHRLPLRPAFDMEITLPRDLTSAEVLRIMEWMRTLTVDPCGEPSPPRAAPTCPHGCQGWCALCADAPPREGEG
jgi:hypothetical protein